VQAGHLLAHGDTIDTQHYTDAESLIGEILKIIAVLRGTHPEVAAVGVGLPGFVDSVNGIVHELTNVAGWDEVPLRAILAERTGLPAIIENDAKAMAYGEWKYGAAQNGRHVVCVTLGTGVGGALILDGRLYRGAQLAAGEIGHASIDYRGVAGPYGDRGGLEEYVGNHQIAARAVDYYRAAGREMTPEQCTPFDLQQAAASGDPVALQLWDDVGTKLGAALASVVWLINPDTIVIGGGVAKAGELLFAPIRRIIAARTVEVIHRDLRVIPAALGNDAGIIGCATLALEAAGLS
jgi:glucokinase